MQTLDSKHQKNLAASASPDVRKRSLSSKSLASLLLTPALLVLAYPRWNYWYLAWVALLPWLSFLATAKAKSAFRWSWLIGTLFFALSMAWMNHLMSMAGPAASLGWLVLSAYLGLYFGAFGFAANKLLAGFARGEAAAGRGHRIAASLSLAAALAAIWTLLEYARSYALSGMGWNLLAYSQTPWIAVLQSAEFAGAWAVSFLIVWVNALLFLAWRDRKQLHAWQPAAVALTTLAVAAGFGAWRMHHFPASSHTLRVAVVQGNIPQEQKWDDAFEKVIVQRYTQLTTAARATSPDLIVWPETSVPGYLGMDEDLTQWVMGLAKHVGRPMLVGTPMLTVPSFALVNRATLVDGQGNLSQTYDKMHLVPFGEFVPFERQMPWLRHVLPPIGSFEPGNRPTVFEVPRQEATQAVAFEGSPMASQGASPAPAEAAGEDAARRFGVLICFEDLFPNIARNFVRRGARWLLVITNDAWFGPSAAAYQHAQASTLRAVEFRVPVARAANTGWSGAIDAAGRWISSVKDAQGRELFVEGFQLCELRPGAQDSLTLYARAGDWFILACCLISILGLAVCLL